MINEEILFNNIKTIYKKIAFSAIKAGRNPEDVRLIAVTKNVPFERVIEAVKAGVSILGENRVQEAHNKVADCKFQLANEKIEWHLIGHLQKNKAKIAVGLFDVIQSVDSIEIADEINKHAEKLNKQQKILLQVKLSEEVTKYGILKENIYELLSYIKHKQNLCMEGLMTIPPFFDNSEMVRPYFRELKRIRDKAEEDGFRLPELSMGMSNDFEAAIEEGATMVRVGTAIFGERK